MLSAKHNALSASDPFGSSVLDRVDMLGWVFVLGGLCISAIFGLLSDGLYMNDDATHFFIARDGVIHSQHSGPLSSAHIAQVLEEIL